MIKYCLKCACSNQFQAWFQSSAACEAQVEGRQVTCPKCGSHDVDKAVMAPNVAARGNLQGQPHLAAVMTKEFTQLLRDVRQSLVKNAENVGPRFAEEARKIHYEEAKAREIYGQASGEEARALLDEGIDVLVLPPLPEDAN